MEPASGEAHATAPAAPSVISSRMTDVVSEDGDQYYPEGTVNAQQRARSGSSGPSSPPATSHSRRNFSSRRGQQGFGGPGLSMTNSSRTQGTSSRGNTSHAPSLTPRAFFRPLSSQRLQAQRSTRPPPSAQDVTPRLPTSGSNRPSMESNHTATPRRPGTALPPSSRGTEFTERDPQDRALYNASPTGNRTNASAGESTSPLHPPGSYVQRRGEGEKPQEEAEQGATSQFRTNFLHLSKSSAPAQAQTDPSQPGRSSDGSLSPHLHEKVAPKVSTKLGRNHEYFTGNTVFCWGGRIQNSRERPINIFTGLLVVVPSVLFFVFA